MEPESFFPGVRIFSMIHADVRRDALERWLAPHLRGAPFTLTAASEDASFRRYWRATLADGATYVVMDAPPDKEDCRPFVRVARMLADAGVHAPKVFAQDLEQGFLLLSDLGTRTYLAELNAGNAARSSSPTRPTRCCAGSLPRGRANCRRTTKRCCGAR